jgi:hypothetical protein
MSAISNTETCGHDHGEIIGAVADGKGFVGRKVMLAHQALQRLEFDV